MNTDPASLGRVSAAFAMATCVTVLFSTVLAWAKDAYAPLNGVMNSLSGHNWITHGIADVLLFGGLGWRFSATNWTQRIAPNRLTVGLAAAVVLAGAGLVVWYAAF